jgi:hypothetical protein
MVETNDADRSSHSSHLFTMRLWLEEVGGGQIDWRGKVQHVTSGEAQYFRDWRSLEVFVEGLLGGSGHEGLEPAIPEHEKEETQGDARA